MTSTESCHEPTLTSLIHKEIQAARYPGVRQVRSFVKEGVLVLHGRVTSFYLKQIAQTLVRRHLQPQIAIDNQISVELFETGR
jgi:hypothetical protein